VVHQSQSDCPSGVTQNRPTIEPGTLAPSEAFIGFLGMSNVLSEEKKQQVIALGKLGWSLRRIQQPTGVRRETASVYLKSSRRDGTSPNSSRRCLITRETSIRWACGCVVRSPKWLFQGPESLYSLPKSDSRPLFCMCLELPKLAAEP